MAKNSPHRNRRHLYDQLVSMDWALERFVSAKGPNKDFDSLPEDEQLKRLNGAINVGKETK